MSQKQKKEENIEDNIIEEQVEETTDQEQWEEGEVFEEIQNDETYECGTYGNESEVEYLQNLIAGAQERLDVIIGSESMVEELSDYEMESLEGGGKPCPYPHNYIISRSTKASSIRISLSSLKGLRYIKTACYQNKGCGYYISGGYLIVKRRYKYMNCNCHLHVYKTRTNRGGGLIITCVNISFH